MIKKIKKELKKVNAIRYFVIGRRLCKDRYYLEGERLNQAELLKKPSRTEIINFLLSLKKEPTCYLEIGVCNPENNFNHIKADVKYSVDPGIEFPENPVDFKMTSNEFFMKLSENKILSQDIRFDVVFIDGLHLAEQVDRDIENALKYVSDNGFVVLHDCNPPTEWHARESYQYLYSPALYSWNGTTWKAFLKWRFNPDVFSCCIDTDWGVGVISRNSWVGNNTKPSNPFFEYSRIEAHRKEYLNLIDFNTFRTLCINNI